MTTLLRDIEAGDVIPGSDQQTWAAKGFGIARPSMRIVVVAVYNQLINNHGLILPGFPGGKRKKQDHTSDATVEREHPEETGVTLVRPYKSVACKWREWRGHGTAVPHWLELFRGQDIADEQLDEQLIGTVRGSNEVINLATAKHDGWEHQFIGMVPGRDEIASCMTVERILSASDQEFIPFYRGLAQHELTNVLHGKDFWAE